MSAQPPSYETAIQDQPGSSSKQHTQQQPQQPAGSDKEQFHALADQLAEEMDSTDESDVDDQGRRKPRRKPTAAEIEERMSMDDEMRELPEGWERCFDQKSGHQFYVDTRAKPPRSIWTHPYDDPEYLQSLPDTHPANPNSSEAQQARSQYDELMAEARRKREGKKAERSTGGKLKDRILGSTKEERDAKRTEKQARRAKRDEEERKARERYLKRRRELMAQQGLSSNSAMMYRSNPYGFAAPAYPYSRMYGGYGGMGMGPRYGYGGGYGMGPCGGIGMGSAAPAMLGLGGGLLLGGALF